MTVTHYVAATGSASRRSLDSVDPERRRCFAGLLYAPPEAPADVPGPGGLRLATVRTGGAAIAAFHDERGAPFATSVMCAGAGDHASATRLLAGVAEGVGGVVPQGDLRDPEPGAWIYTFVVPIAGVADEQFERAGAYVLDVYAALFAGRE